MEFPLPTSISLYYLLAILCSYAVYQLFLSPLAKVPGPFSAKLSRFWLTQLSWKGDSHKVQPELHRQYGSLVRIAPNEVSVTDAKAVKEIYKPGSPFHKSEWYSVWQGTRKFDIFAGRDEKIHGIHRRLVNFPYSMSYLKPLEGYVDSALNVFFNYMEEVRQQGVVDIGKWVQLMAYDMMGEITFSRRFGFMDAGEDDGALFQIELASRSASWVGQVPWLYWLHHYLTPVIGNHLAINMRHGYLRNIAIQHVDERKERGSDHADILSRLLSVHEEKPEEFPLVSVQSMASTNIFAGSDTTAITLRAIIYYLMRYPDAKEKLIQELDDFRATKGLSDPVTLAEANEMPYLQAVMWEALRLHPAIGMTMPRIVPEGGFEVAGHFLPAGTVIGANAWAVNRVESIYGEKVDDFIPERWLKDDLGEMRRCFLTFGAGNRICIGQNISWMEISKFVPTLFMKYDVNLANPDDEWTLTSWWFVVQKGVKVTLQPRQTR